MPAPTPIALFGIIYGMEKFFNIVGPCDPARHYMLPATERIPGIEPRIHSSEAP